MANVGSAVLLSSSIQYIINVVMTVPALIWIDKWGRRLPLLIGAALMATWMYANAGIVAMYSRPARPNEFDNAAESFSISGAPASGLIACTYLFVASYAPTWGPVSWIYPPELYPLRIRGKAVALATSSNWAFNFALAYFVPPAFEQISWKVYILFGVFCTVMFIHVFFMFPETAGKTLEEVENIFDDTATGATRYVGIPAWRTHIDKHIRREEQGDVDPEKLAALNAFHAETGGAAAVDTKASPVSDQAPKV